MNERQKGILTWNGKHMLLNVHIVSKKDEFQDSIEQMQWIWTLTLGKCKLIVLADLWQRKALYSLLILLQFETITAKTYISFQVPFSIERKSPNGYLVGRKANPPGHALLYFQTCVILTCLCIHGKDLIEREQSTRAHKFQFERTESVLKSSWS